MERSAGSGIMAETSKSRKVFQAVMQAVGLSRKSLSAMESPPVNREQSPTPELPWTSPKADKRRLRVLLIADRPGWCFSRRAAALKRWAPSHISIDVVHYGHSGLLGIPFPQYDCVLCLPPNKSKDIRLILTAAGLNNRVPLISSWNSGPGREGYELGEILPYVDWAIINNWQSYALALKRAGGRLNACHISNGVDLGFYFPTTDISQRPRKVLWIAAYTKAYDEGDVKGWQAIAEPLSKILNAQGIETDFRTVEFEDELSETGMREFYNSGQVFLITSISEGTPNVGLEAAACGCAVVSSRVGNMLEIIRDRENGVLVERVCWPPTRQFLEAIHFALDNASRLGMAARESMERDFWDWDARSRFYYRVFEAAASGELATMRPWSYLDRDLQFNGEPRYRVDWNPGVPA